MSIKAPTVQDKAEERKRKNMPSVEPQKKSSRNEKEVKIEKAPSQSKGKSEKSVTLNEGGVLSEREKIIKFIKAYTATQKQIPTTTEDYY